MPPIWEDANAGIINSLHPSECAVVIWSCDGVPRRVGAKHNIYADEAVVAELCKEARHKVLLGGMCIALSIPVYAEETGGGFINLREQARYRQTAGVLAAAITSGEAERVAGFSGHRLPLLRKSFVEDCPPISTVLRLSARSAVLTPPLGAETAGRAQERVAGVTPTPPCALLQFTTLP
eukprot:6213922-Pleurochrysis_carterae.AAC.2